MGKRFRIRPVFVYPGKKYSTDELDSLRQVGFLIGFVSLVAGILQLPHTDGFFCIGLALLYLGFATYYMQELKKNIKEEREWQEYLDRTRETAPPDEQ